MRDQDNGKLYLHLESDNSPVIAVGSHSLIFHVGDISFPFHGADVIRDDFRKWHDVNFPWGIGIEISMKITDPPNSAPVFDEGTDTSRDFDETIGDFTPTIAVNIGIPVDATDTDTADTLTYSLEGTDAAKFGVDDTNGQLQTKAGQNYDYETKQSYSVTLKVTDSRGASDTITVTLNVTDQDESSIEPTPADSCEGIWCATLTPRDLGDNSWGCGSCTARNVQMSTTFQRTSSPTQESITPLTAYVSGLTDDWNCGSISISIWTVGTWYFTLIPNRSHFRVRMRRGLTTGSGTILPSTGPLVTRSH